MNRMKSVALVVSGAVLGVAFVVACPGTKDSVDTAYASDGGGRAVLSVSINGYAETVDGRYLYQAGTWSSGVYTEPDLLTGGVADVCYTVTAEPPYTDSSRGTRESVDFSGCCPAGFKPVAFSGGLVQCLEN